MVAKDTGKCVWVIAVRDFEGRHRKATFGSGGGLDVVVTKLEGNLVDHGLTSLPSGGFCTNAGAIKSNEGSSL